MAHTKTAVPLATSLRRQLIWIGLAFAISSLLLMFSFAVYSVDMTSNSMMRLEAESIAREAQQSPQQPLPQSRTLSAWHSWSEIPDSILQHFTDTTLTPNEPLEAEIKTAAGETDYLYLLHHQSTQYGDLYVSSYHTASEVEEIIVNLLGSALIQALGLTLLILLVLFIVIAWLIRRTLEPLNLLSQWATELNQQPDKAMVINFPITELNQLALHLRQGVDSVRTVNEREQQFLKHASHELRTPLAVIQASLDTLSLQTQADSPAQRSTQRALKASNRMIQLSDTLLWLARDADKTIAKEALNAAALSRQLVDDHRYLISAKTIEVQQHYQEEEITVEVPLLSIVLSNLIRNAFQHSGDGVIRIELNHNSLVISNPVDDDLASEQQGFGLGLQLVQRICQKLGWQFSFQLDKAQARVQVSWPN